MQDLRWIESSSINPSVYSKMPTLMGQNKEKGRGRETDIFIWADDANVWWFKKKTCKEGIFQLPLLPKEGSPIENLLCHATFMIKAKGTYIYTHTHTHKHTLIIPWAFGSEALAGSDELQHCYGWLQVSSTFSPLPFPLSQMLWQIPFKR